MVRKLKITGTDFVVSCHSKVAARISLFHTLTRSVTMSTSAKLLALTQVFKGVCPFFIGGSKYKLNQNTVHVRFCSVEKGRAAKFKYNINPNTLSADFELWVCGDASTYYLMPVALMQTIYGDSDTYVDHAHPEIRVVSVDTSSHNVNYGRGGKF